LALISKKTKLRQEKDLSLEFTQCFE